MKKLMIENKRLGVCDGFGRHDEDLGDDAVHFGANDMLHLHGANHDDAVTPFHRLVNLAGDFDNGPSHGRNHSVHPRRSWSESVLMDSTAADGNLGGR